MSYEIRKTRASKFYKRQSQRLFEKFAKALEESENDVKHLLIGTVDAPGILSRVEAIIENAISGTGYFQTKTSSLNREIANYDKKIEKATQNMEFYKQMLERKFGNMESMYTAMNSSYQALISGGI